MRLHTPFLILPLLILCVALPATASAYTYPVTITGDDVVESNILRSRDKSGLSNLGSLVYDQLKSRGEKMGSYGFVPMHASTILPTTRPWSFKGQWIHAGLLGKDIISYGPDSLSSLSVDNKASVSLTIPSIPSKTEYNMPSHIGLLYGAGPDGGSFKVSINGGSPVTIQGQADTKSAALQWLPAKKASGAASAAPLILKVYSIQKGSTIRLSGAMLSREFDHRGYREIQINQVGRSGMIANAGLMSIQKDALAQLNTYPGMEQAGDTRQGTSLTIIMFGNTEEGLEIQNNDLSRRASYRTGLLERAKIAKRTGGKCVIVPPAPNGKSLSVQKAYYDIAKKAAEDGDCKFRDLFQGIWPNNLSQSKGFTEDGSHPTIKGYRLMAVSLASFINSFPTSAGSSNHKNAH